MDDESEEMAEGAEDTKPAAKMRRSDDVIQKQRKSKKGKGKSDSNSAAVANHYNLSDDDSVSDGHYIK